MKKRLVALLLSVPFLCPVSSWSQDAVADANTKEKPSAQQDEQFLEALDSVFPLDPTQIHNLRNRQDQVQEAITKTPVAKISSESRPLLLEPGQVPPPVILTPGYVGAVAFFDATGAPWPVSRAVIGNDGLFNLVTATGAANAADVPGGDTHILYITPLREHANSNVLVHLQGSPNPVVVALVSDPSSKMGRRHQGIVNFMVRARGPNAKPPIFTSVSPTISDAMMSFLDGIPPAGAVPLTLTPTIDGMQAWKVGGKTYIRGVHTLIWPAYSAYAESSGTYVYEMATVPSVMISMNGVSTSITLETEVK